MQSRSALVAAFSFGALASLAAACSDDNIDFPDYNPPAAGTGGTGGTGPGTGGAGNGGSGPSSGAAGTNAGTGGSGGGALPPDVDPCVAQNSCAAQPITEDIQAPGGVGEVIWTSDKFWTLQKVTYVLPGTTLRIKAGTVVKGVKGSAAGAASAIVVQKGAKIIAEGTASAPVVFTSNNAVGARAPGDWGGLVLCGNARINNPATNPPRLNIEGLPNEERNLCGGEDDADSSGELHYVRIEYAGFKLEADIELNGLSLYGVGSGTAIDHVQVHLGSDDGIEWFGGTVNVKYALVTGAQDDSFDWGYGFRGKLQYGIALQDDIGPSGNGIEADNINKNLADEYGDPTLVASPTFANLTLLGASVVAGDGKSGMLFRRTTRASIYNALIAGFNKQGGGVGVSIEGVNTAANATDGSLAVINSRLLDNPADFASDQPLTPEAWLFAPASGNTQLPAGSLPALTGLLLSQLSTMPSLAQAADSPLMLAAAPASPVPNDPFFEPVNFVGACGASCTEFEGWTAFPQQ